MVVFKQQTGFTLIEILLSIGLSAFILSGAYLLFASHHQSYLAQLSVMQVQESGRVAINLLRDRIRMSGSLGCTAWHQQLPVYQQAQLLPTGLPKQANEIVYAYHFRNGTWSPPLPNYLLGRVRENTDVLVAHQAHVQSANLSQTMVSTQSSLILSDDLNLKTGDAIVVADCEQADIVQVSDISRSGNQWFIAHYPPYNKSNYLSKTYTTHAQVNLLQSAVYYIGHTGRYYANGDPIYALYQFVGEQQELIEGVNDLQVEFGVDTNFDNAVDTFMPMAPQLGKGILRSVMLTLETQSLAMVDNEFLKQKWFADIALRNF